MRVAGDAPGVSVGPCRGAGARSERRRHTKGGFPWVVELLWGTVLEPGAAAAAPRALAAGQSAAAFYHVTCHARGWGELDALPGGAEWRRRGRAVTLR